MEEKIAYQRLAARLDALPNGFPATPDGAELRLLASIFTPEEAELAAGLRLTHQTPEQIAAQIGADPAELRQKLKGMARRGLITAGPTEGGLGYGLLPFVVGIYEMQISRLDAELAALFEDYFQKAFKEILSVQPAVHRVIPVKESVRVGLEVRPFESTAEILSASKAWGVLDCICRKQKQLVGDPCEHPVDVCMAFSSTPGAFDRSSVVKALTREEAMSTLHRAAEAGLVHTVSNNQKDLWYVCNCCTCSCGVLRGMAEMGVANVVARSAYVVQVDDERCIVCGDCLERCQFNALSLESTLVVLEGRCMGCGVCAVGCEQEAMSLGFRAEADIHLPPETEMDWKRERAAARHIRLEDVL